MLFIIGKYLKLAVYWEVIKARNSNLNNLPSLVINPG